MSAALRQPLVPVVGAVLAGATFVLSGHDANAALWAVVQLWLVAIAAVDLATRRIPNELTLTAAIGAVALRVAFERDELLEIVVAGAICFVVLLLLAIVARGGFGMGDVKLAGVLGLLLGRDVAGALLLGTVCGAVAALIAARRAGSLKATLAYGPYLCLGAAVVILVTSPPALV
jgi:leader peptidase (prepilin peptidase) / N-methyltransferase